MKSNLLFLTLILFLNNIYAQNNYVYISPKPNSILVSNETNIILRSASIVDRSSVVSNLIHVEGSQSGLHSGKLILTDDERTIIFNPGKPFSGNEAVHVSIQAGIKSSQGIINSCEFSFTTMPEDEQPLNKLSSNSSLQKSNETSAWLPAPPIKIDTVNNPSPGYIFLATWDRNTPLHKYGNYIFILDNYGNIVDSTRVNGAPFDFKIQPNGLLSYGLGDYSGITPGNSNLKQYVLDSTLAVVDSFQMKNGYLTDFHDFILLPNGHAMLMSYNTVTYDMSKIIPGGKPDAQVVIDVFQEQDANKNVVFEWRDIDFIPITDTDLRLTDPRINPSTLNAFDLDNDGNLLFSFRNHSDIMKISRETGEILWRWGGLKNEFTFVGEHEENAPYYFARQHNVHRLLNGDIVIFDNGEFHSPWYSRAAEYQIDEVNKIAELVSEYRYSPGNISTQAAGNAERLSNGGWFVGYGILDPASPVMRNIVEVHADGSKAFELTLPTNVIAYRVSKQPWKQLIEKILVSNAEVLQGVTYSFNKNGNTTGVSINYVQLSGDTYNNVSITRLPYGPIKPEFISDAPIIYPVSILYAGAAISSHTSEMHFDLSAFPEIKQPSNTAVYMREFPGQGLFIELPTVYDSLANELIAATSIFGEIIFGKPDFQQGTAKPVLIEPLNNNKVLAENPILLKWGGHGLLQSFNLQIAADSLFNQIVLDTVTNNSFVQTGNLFNKQKYYWRVNSKGSNNVSDWSNVWSFEPADPFIQMVTPDGGEIWYKGDTTIVRWESNISDSVKLEIINGEINSGLLGKSKASINAYQWIIPVSISAGASYRIRIVSMEDTTISDTSKTVFSITNATSVEKTYDNLPNYFALFQNYPNPFNPTTKIKYTIPSSGEMKQYAPVQLKVFDVMGREVATLVNENKPAGTYEVTWNAANLPSGVYFYQLKAGNPESSSGQIFTATKKLILLK
jgi:hypothetical protein